MGRHILVLPVVLVGLAALKTAPGMAAEKLLERAGGQADSASAVPAWDASGCGLLPRQGVACLAISDDASTIAVGTIAPGGEPNVLVLDDRGNLLRRHRAGVRWIDQLAVTRQGATLWAISGTPAGKPSDMPELFRLDADGVACDDLARRHGGLIFHYGDHSNHAGTRLANTAGGAVLVALSAAATGLCVVGCVTSETSGPDAENLFVLERGARAPVWSRAAVRQMGAAERLEPGRYGTPIPNFGPAQPQELQQRDVPCWAPLSVAIRAENQGDPAASGWLVAAADYPGWQRLVESSATGQFQRRTVRLVPSRPVIHVYDHHGGVVRRFEPAAFKQPIWCDLVFWKGGRVLLAYPHHWTCRGLAGRPVLPADGQARTLYLLHVDTGSVDAVDFPDAISDVAVCSDRVAVGCWNGSVYRLTEDELRRRAISSGCHVGGPSLLAYSADGSRLVAAEATGIVHCLNQDDRLLWRTELDRVATSDQEPAQKTAASREEFPGIWSNPGGLQSDMGAQRVIEAPQGLILIDPNAGHSFDQQWAAMESAGLDPTQVKYVLLTHEHGDHAPGAYLWRVVAGAKVVCSEEVAYSLQHEIPAGSGYGFHPPGPADVKLSGDAELRLAGLAVRAVRLPGHTFGSMGWAFENRGTTYVATGDLIMPDGVLGYSGSVNFSARDVIASLGKLGRLGPDVVLLPGHGKADGPGPYVAAGLETGLATGWGKTPPEKPNPYFRVPREDYLVVGWNRGAVAADCRDVDGDGRPDVVMLVPAGLERETTALVVFLNHRGVFREEPDFLIELSQLNEGSKVLVGDFSGDGRGDFLVDSESERTTLLLLSTEERAKYRIESIDGVHSAQHWLVADLDGDGRREALVGEAFAGAMLIEEAAGGRLRSRPSPWQLAGQYLRPQLTDVNGDGLDDLFSSSGAVHLRNAEQGISETPTLNLAPPDVQTWTFGVAADFSADGRPDAALVSFNSPRLCVYYHTGSADRPYAGEPDAALDLVAAFQAGPQPRNFNRAGPAVGDFNGDGHADLVLSFAQDEQVAVMFGGAGGLSPQRSRILPMACRLHYQMPVAVDDFDGNGRPDLAVFANTLNAGVGQSGGPTAVFIRLQ